MGVRTVFTPEDDCFIQRHYEEKGAAWIAEQLGCTPLQARGRFHGLARKARRAAIPVEWTPEEDAYLELIAGTMPPRLMCKKFRSQARKENWTRGRERTDTAIKQRIFDLQISRKPEVYHYTPPQLEEAIGISKVTIRRWIDRGLLKAQRNEPGNESSTWLIHIKDFLAFLVANPSVMESARKFNNYSAQWLLVQLGDYGVRSVYKNNSEKSSG